MIWGENPLFSETSVYFQMSTRKGSISNLPRVKKKRISSPRQTAGPAWWVVSFFCGLQNKVILYSFRGVIFKQCNLYIYVILCIYVYRFVIYTVYIYDYCVYICIIWHCCDLLFFVDFVDCGGSVVVLSHDHFCRKSGQGSASGDACKTPFFLQQRLML